MNPKHPEYVDVVNFTVESLEPSCGGHVMVEDVYNAYREWRFASGKCKTKCSVTGFGKMIPSTFERKLNFNGGDVKRAIHGYKLRGVR